MKQQGKSMGDGKLTCEETEKMYFNEELSFNINFYETGLRSDY